MPFNSGLAILSRNHVYFKNMQKAGYVLFPLNKKKDV